MTTSDQRFWDRVARKYAGDPIADMAAYERTIARTIELLQPTDRVLELGCGTGMTALKIAPHVQHITGTDISPEMITIAKERAAEAGVTNATFKAASATDAGDGEPFDAVLAFNLLHLVRNRRGTLNTIRTQLRPGGLFISKTPCLSEMNPLIRLAVPVAKLFGKAPYVSFFSGHSLETEVTAAGFEVIANERHGSKAKDARMFLVAR